MFGIKMVQDLDITFYSINSLIRVSLMNFTLGILLPCTIMNFPFILYHDRAELPFYILP